MLAPGEFRGGYDCQFPIDSNISSEEQRMLRKAVAFFLVCVGLAVCVGCSKNANHYVYAAIPNASQILAYREDPNSGALTPLDTSPFTAGLGVQSIVIHPSKQFLYAANSALDNISLFTIASTGAITEVPPRTNTGTTPAILVMDPAGNYLYVANSASNDIWVYSINSSSSPPTLTLIGTVGLGLTPLNMVLSPSGNFLYVTGAGFPGLIEVWSVNPTAAPPLTLVQVQPTGDSPFGLAIDPTGSFLYTANFSDNSISEFSISGGSLTELAGSPIGQTYTSPISLLVDNSGKYLYAANQGSGNLSAYAIASSGGLTLLSSSPFATGAQPSVIASDPNGLYLFVGNQKSPAIESFSLATSTGSLSEVGSYNVGNTPASIAVVP